MGDMLTLIEQAEKTFDRTRRSRPPAKLTGEGGDFTLDDFLEQMQAGPQAGLAVEDHGDAARDGAVPRPARELRRARDRPDPGDHPVDDPGGAGQRRRSSTARAAPASRGAPGRPGLRRQPARRPVLRGPQDDDVPSPAAAACPVCPACPGCPAPASAPQQGQGQEGQGQARLGQPRQGAPSRRRPAPRRRRPSVRRQPVRHCPGARPMDYEKAAALSTCPRTSRSTSSSRVGSEGRPSRWSLTATRLALRLVPPGGARRRWTRATAELWGMSPAEQLRHTRGAHSRPGAPSSRHITRPQDRGGRHEEAAPVPVRLARRLETQYSSDGTGRFLRCRRCRKESELMQHPRVVA